MQADRKTDKQRQAEQTSLKRKREGGNAPQVDLKDVLGDKNYTRELRVFAASPFFFGAATKYR